MSKELSSSGKALTLSIITPEKPVLEKRVEFIAFPAYNGECGVLPGHARFLAELVAGIVRIQAQGETQTLAISGGYAEVHPDRVDLFCETAEVSDDINEERARLAKESALHQISKAQNSEDLAKAEAALKRAIIRLKVSQRTKRSSR